MAMVGASDVQVKLPDRLRNLGVNLQYSEQMPSGWLLCSPREDGKALWEAYRRNNVVGQLIDLPILRPCIEYIRNLGLGNQLIAYLFYTDNLPQKVADRIRSKDTLFFARIAEKWLPDYFGRFNFNVKIGRVLISRRYSPVSSSDMLSFFGKRLTELAPPEEVKWVFTSQTGGIPTVYESLFLQAIRIYRDKCTPLYVLPNGTVFPVDFKKFLLSTFYREHARGLVEGHHYIQAANLLERLNLPFHAALCRHAAYRLLFDLKRARKALEDIPSDIQLTLQEEAILDGLQKQVQELAQELPETGNRWDERINRLRAWIQELYWGIEIAANQGAWLEVLGRIIRFAEAILQLVIEEIFKQPATTIQQISNIAQFIENRHNFPMTDIIETFPSRTNLNMLRIIAEITQNIVNDAMLSVALNFVTRIESLITLRNRSILWHGFQGISEEEILGRFGGTKQDLFDACLNALKGLGIPVAENPYEKVKQVVLGALREEE